MCLDPEGMLYVSPFIYENLTFFRSLSVGESFFQVSEEEAVNYLEKARNVSEDILAQNLAESTTLRTEMDELKRSLYAKFGSAINLEDK